jgi:hypothetical protein
VLSVQFIYFDLHCYYRTRTTLVLKPLVALCSCRYVEVMAPVFTKAAWKCVWHMIQVISCFVRREDALGSALFARYTLEEDNSFPLKVWIIDALPGHPHV